MRAANVAKERTNKNPYLNTIHRRCLFCLVENRGARICFEGRNQKSIVACKRSANGAKSGGDIMNNNRCPSKKSELQRDISTILTMNSRAGRYIA